MLFPLMPLQPFPILLGTFGNEHAFGLQEKVSGLSFPKLQDRVATDGVYPLPHWLVQLSPEEIS